MIKSTVLWIADNANVTLERLDVKLLTMYSSVLVAGFCLNLMVWIVTYLNEGIIRDWRNNFVGGCMVFSMFLSVAMVMAGTVFFCTWFWCCGKR